MLNYRLCYMKRICKMFPAHIEVCIGCVMSCLQYYYFAQAATTNTSLQFIAGDKAGVRVAS